MKKLIILSMLFAGACATANAQDTKENYYNQKWTDNIYVGAGIGGMAVFNDGMNSPTFNFNIKVGKQITPVWGTRLQFGVCGKVSKLKSHKTTATIAKCSANSI